MSGEPNAAENAGRVGPYRLDGLLGRGGMGEVWRGFDQRLERPVAIKRVKPELLGGDAAKRFRREAKAAARLSHAAIVHVYDWVEDEGGAWLVMELVEGCNLRELLEEGLPLPRALAIARDLAAGLAAAHAAGIVHRDLKPGNVMVGASGAKILDFGLARLGGPPAADSSLTDSLTEPGKVVGTVAAMAPEQALGREVDHRCDLFALGSLLYEMVTGSAPFAAPSAVATLTRICTEKQRPAHESNPAVPPPLSELIDRLLVKDPALRLGNAAEVVAILDSGICGAIAPVALLKLKSGSADAEVTAASGLLAFAGGEGDLGLGPRLRGGDDRGSGAFSKLLLHRKCSPESGSEPEPTNENVVAQRLHPGEVEGATPSKWVLPPFRPRRGGQGGEVRSSRWWPALLAIVLLAASIIVFWPRHGGPGAMSAPQLLEAGYDLLERYDQKDNIEKAASLFQRQLALEPRSAAGHAGLALAYAYLAETESKDPDWLKKAGQVAARAVELDPFLAKALVARAFVAFQEGRAADARADLERAGALDPLAWRVPAYLARLEAAAGRLDAAVALLAAVRARDPERWQLAMEKGSHEFRAGRYPEARADFEQVIRLTPDNALGYRNLSGVHFAEGDLARAATFLQKAIEIEPKSTLYSNLGTILFAQGLYGESVAAFETSLELAGGGHDYRLWANLADACRWTPGRETQAGEAYARALQLLGEKLEAKPGDPVLRSRRTLYLAKSGACPAALPELAALAGDSAADGAILYRRAVALEICGDRPGALAALDSALGKGYSLADVQSDPELRRLREDPDYHRRLARRSAAQ